MNRFDHRDSQPRSTRVAALVAGGVIAAVALGGCSAGQLSQTASQESAVDGSAAVIKNGQNDIALRNVRIQAQQNTDFLRPGATLDLTLVVVNQKPDVTDKLVGVTTDIGTVTVTGDPTLAPGGTLFVGTPDGQNHKAVAAVEAATFAKATVTLTQQITNGPNYHATFTFEHAGSVSLAVPISAPEGPPLAAQHP